MKLTVKLILTTYIVLLIVSRGCPQSFSNARALGMSDAYTCLAVGAEAACFNPANLSFPMRYSTTINLAGFGGYVTNNSFNINDYNYYNGAILSEKDKISLLANIPENGLYIDSNSAAHVLGLSFKSLALTAQLNTQLYSTISKTVLDLALNGNELNKVYEFAPIKAEGSVYGQVALSYGLALPVKNKLIQHAGIGASIKYLRGFSYFDIIESSVITTAQFTSADAFGKVTSINATGGHGYTLDIGSVLAIKRSRLAFVLKNISSNLLWDKDTELIEYSFELEEKNVQKFFDKDFTADSLFSTTDTTIVLNSFSTELPTTIQFGYMYLFRKLLIAAEIAHHLNSNIAAQTTKFSMGLEYRPISYVHLRAGSQVSKNYGISTSMGFGLLLGIVRWDVAAKLYNAVLPQNSKGLSFATSLILRL